MLLFPCRPRLSTFPTVYIPRSRSRVMSNDHDQQSDLQEKIATQIQAEGLVPRKELTAEELQKLKSAATRLDQLINAAENADRESLKAAAARLEQFLADIATGKDVIAALKRRTGRRMPQD